MKKLFILVGGICFAVALFIGYKIFSSYDNESTHVINSAKLLYLANTQAVKDRRELIVEVLKIS